MNRIIRPGTLRLLSVIQVVVSALVASGLLAKSTLQIDRALIGATGAWREVTGFLRQHLSGGTLSVKLEQPFTVGGVKPYLGLLRFICFEPKGDLGVPRKVVLTTAFHKLVQLAVGRFGSSGT